MPVCIIPARGGSKRIPRKNIRAFAGRPIIEWSIQAALTSRLFDRVIVSTDDEEIATVSRAAGAETPFMRPPDLSEDHTSTVDVIAHASRWLSHRSVKLSTLCCLYATAPLVQPEDIARAYARLKSGEWDYVIPVARFPGSPYRAFIEDEDGRIAMLFPQYEATRSQDLPPVYHDAGQFYWGQSEAWLAGRPIYSSRSSIIELPAHRAVDIDTLADWHRAEQAMALLQADGFLTPTI